jgi:HSP20 family protein
MGRKPEGLTHSFFLPAARSCCQPHWQPPVDVYQTDKGWLVKFDLAGVCPQELELERSGSSLRVCGMRRDVLLAEGQRPYSLEIAYNRFERTVELPDVIEPMSVSTEYIDGMLVVRLEGP